MCVLCKRTQCPPEERTLWPLGSINIVIQCTLNERTVALMLSLRKVVGGRDKVKHSNCENCKNCENCDYIEMTVSDSIHPRFVK